MAKRYQASVEERRERARALVLDLARSALLNGDRLENCADELQEVANLLDPQGLDPDTFRLLLDTQPNEDEDEAG
jgi:hypothetical protein